MDFIDDEMAWLISFHIERSTMSVIYRHTWLVNATRVGDFFHGQLRIEVESGILGTLKVTLCLTKVNYNNFTDT